MKWTFIIFKKTMDFCSISEVCSKAIKATCFLSNDAYNWRMQSENKLPQPPFFWKRHLKSKLSYKKNIFKKRNIARDICRGKKFNLNWEGKNRRSRIRPGLVSIVVISYEERKRRWTSLVRLLAVFSKNRRKKVSHFYRTSYQDMLTEI